MKYKANRPKGAKFGYLMAEEISPSTHNRQLLFSKSTNKKRKLRTARYRGVIIHLEHESKMNNSFSIGSRFSCVFQPCSQNNRSYENIIEYKHSCIKRDSISITTRFTQNCNNYTLSRIIAQREMVSKITFKPKQSPMKPWIKRNEWQKQYSRNE